MEFEKSLAQEVRQKSDISERRSKGWRGFVPFNSYFLCNTSNYVTVRPVRGHLTPKMNIAFFYQKFDAEYFFIQQFFRKKLYFQRKPQKTVLGARLTIF